MKHRILEKCISLLDNSTDELNRFPAARGVAQKVIRLKEKTQKLMLCLKQTMLLIKLVSWRNCFFYVTMSFHCHQCLPFFFLMLTYLQICTKLFTLAILLYNDYFAKKCGINCIFLRLVISLEIIAPHSQSIRGNRSCFLAHSAGCMTLLWFLTDSFDCYLSWL